MYKLFILTIAVGSFVFSGTWNNTSTSDEKSNTNPVKKQYCWVENINSDDSKLEARRRGKRNKGRGGRGLR